MKIIFSKFKYLSLVLLLIVLACGGDSEDPTVEPPIAKTLAGDYTGTWDSTTPSATFSGVPVSARLTANAQETTLSGSFFITSNFVPCCGSTNDGTIRLTIDGSSITSFTYADAIPGCTGNFSGTGEINSNTGALIISFTGTDCDGDHIGELVLTK